MTHDELVADTGEHGLLQPIVLHNGRIFDSGNRDRACQHAGAEPHCVVGTWEPA